MESSTKRTKIAGAVIAATLLVVVGVVALNNGNVAQQAQMMPLEHAEQLARAQNANTPLANLPDESQVQTPEGWEIESDKPVDGSDDGESVSEDSNDDLEEEEQEQDDDIDSPLMVEQDEHGEDFVAELGDNVIVDGDESQHNEGEEVVAADGVKGRRCYKNLKACGAKKACYRKCNKRCKPYAIRRCRRKKFCRCFCKYYGKRKSALKCIIYKRNVCTKVWTYRCKRRCHKFCKKVPRCYCCPKTHIRRKCRRVCKRIQYRSKCRRCRCLKIKCYNMCRLLCIKKY